MLKTTKITIKKSLGVVLIILGLTALITPFTPGAWLAFIGLELLGLRLLFQNKASALWQWLRKLL